MLIRNRKAVLATGVAVAVLVPSVAIGAGEGSPLLGGKRNPSRSAFASETKVIANASTYGTRQSNLREGDGGGAIYGCRSNANNEPCIRASNLRTGRAFEFKSGGREAGRIEVGDVNGAPLTTNARGVATGFNADQVDGRDASDFAAAGALKFAVVGADGALGARRGATAATAPDATTRAATVTFDADVSGCSFTAAPTGASQDAAYGVARGSDARTVVVDQPDSGTPTGFHLQVIC
jgi:hypothetical protein